jgi:DNA-binding NtrC family response regulator
LKKKNMTDLRTIVIVDDNDTMRIGMAESLRRDGYQVFEFACGPDALNHLNENSAELLITDLKMEPMDGIQLLEKGKAAHPEMEALLVSAYGSVQDAVKAMQLGASDFLTKPFSPDELRVRVRKIFQKIENDRLINHLRDQNLYLEQEVSGQYENIIGNTPEMKTIFNLIDRVAGEDSSVLIEGESGTGKELVARAIHKKSNRSGQPFIRVNCGALNDNLLESELFGHEKGAFTGAIRQKKGRFELSDKGTLFLDEIGDISATMQVKLLRALQEKEFERVGGEKTLKVDVRIITATNQSLKDLIRKGSFREDLFYRLSVIPIRLPALRERKDDIPKLIEYFINKLNQQKQQIKSVSSEAVELLKDYPWPGNIRELENLIERLHIICPENSIPGSLAAQFLGKSDLMQNNHDHLPLEDALYHFEKQMIIQAMEKAKGVKNQAAKLLGIGTSSLYYKLEKFGLLK